MIFASGLGIVLSLVFGCLLLALVAELYYLLWWKKLRINSSNSRVEDDYGTTHAKELFYLFCWSKPVNPSNINRQATVTTNAATREAPSTNPEPNRDPELGLGSSKEFLLRALGGDQDALVEAELMRLHNRFLFTIKEETKEDLESEDVKSKASRKGSRTRSLSDLILAVDTPFLSPLSSPPLMTATKNRNPLDCYNLHGFNPLFESSAVEAELNRLRTSPPPKFKFLRDAEEKLYRRLLQEAEKIKIVDGNAGFQNSDEGDGKDGSFIRIIVGKNNHHSSSSQVLPLASSPTSLTSSIDKKPILG